MALTTKVERLSTLVERNLQDDNDKEDRLRKLERWAYSIPVAYVLALGTMVTTLVRTTGN